MKSKRLGLVLLCLLVGATGVAHASTYSYITVNVPDATSATANGINNSGQIVGAYGNGAGQYGFLYSGGNYTTITVPAATYTTANGINATGQIVGIYYDSSGASHGFLYSGGNYTTLDDPLATGRTYANGINKSGQIVGQYGDSGGGIHGFLYSGGNYTTLDHPLATSNPGITVAQGINDAGQIVGYFIDGSSTLHGFLYSGGNYTTLDDPLGTKGNIANGINATGQIVGIYYDSSGASHGFLYSGGNYTTLDDPLATYATYANGINNSGQIVGSYVYKSGNSSASGGFLATPTALQVSPATNIVASGIQGEAFSPTSFSYQLSSTSGSVNYQITGIPPWLNANFVSGTATTSPVTVTFSLINVGRFRPDTYTATIAFTNASTGNGNTTRIATLTVDRATKADCKDGGWRNFISPPRPFKNEGRCVSYFEDRRKDRRDGE